MELSYYEDDDELKAGCNYDIYIAMKDLMKFIMNHVDFKQLENFKKVTECFRRSVHPLYVVHHGRKNILKYLFRSVSWPICWLLQINELFYILD